MPLGGAGCAHTEMSLKGSDEPDWYSTWTVVLVGDGAGGYSIYTGFPTK